MKYWKIIGDNLSKAGCIGIVYYFSVWQKIVLTPPSELAESRRVKFGRRLYPGAQPSSRRETSANKGLVRPNDDILETVN
jgi:hypothetical protein